MKIFKNIENFLILNPWRQGNYTQFEKSYVKRWLFDRIIRWIEGDDILIIHGPRQVGKTTLLFMLMNYLIKTKKTDPRDIFYFNAEDTLLKTDFFENYVDLYEFVKKERQNRAYIFCDEAQKIPAIGIFLKNLYDLKDPNIKIIVTGSSSLELKQKTHESLTGRKKIFQLYPFSFKEYLKLKTGNDEWIAAHKNPEAFEEFVTYGGYPKVALAESDFRKKAELHEIYSSYLQKDIKDFLNIGYPDIFNRLVRILADQIGDLINIHELSNTLGINRLTVEKYLKILEETFVIHRLPPFFKNPRKEITKMQKIYFLDTGLRNYIDGNLTFFSSRSDIGKVSENHVFSEYYKPLRGIQKLNFWRTQNKTEVDFILSLEKEIIPIEIKYGFLGKNPPLPLRNFIEMHQPKEAVIFSKLGGEAIKMGDTIIYHIPIKYCGTEKVIASFALPFHRPLNSLGGPDGT